MVGPTAPSSSTWTSRPGGTWRFAGNGMVFAGEYREVAPPERLVQTFTRAGFPGGHVETMTFEDLGERTRFTMTMLFDTTGDRDNVLTYGGGGRNERDVHPPRLAAREGRCSLNLAVGLSQPCVAHRAGLRNCATGWNGTQVGSPRNLLFLLGGLTLLQAPALDRHSR